MPQGTELDQQAVSVSIEDGQITAKLLYQVMKQLIKRHEIAADRNGQMDIKKLDRQGKQLECVELPAGEFRDIKKQLNQYGIDFAVLMGRKKCHCTLRPRMWTGCIRGCRSVLTSVSSRKKANQNNCAPRRRANNLTGAKPVWKGLTSHQQLI